VAVFYKNKNKINTVIMLKKLFNKKLLRTAVGVGSFAVALFLFVFADAKPVDAKYYTRAEWGCPEANYSNSWAPQYEYAGHVIVHHTAGSWNTSDPASTVRAIWSYHAITLGWGDIGYNYLIDPYGNVYEGRYGGEDVIGAHANTYNRGSIGISILGTYTYNDISAAARDSLNNLIAQKLGSKGIDPNSSAYFPSRWSSNGEVTPDYWGRTGWNAPRVDGHRAYHPKDCPGSYFYTTFGNLRTVSSQRAPSYYTRPWEFVSKHLYTDKTLATPVTVSPLPGDKLTVKIVIKNKSSNTWYNSGANPVNLGTSTPRDRKSLFADSSWIGENKNRPATMEEESVPPEGFATFIFDIEAPATKGNYVEYFTPVVEGAYWMSNKGMYINIGVTGPIYTWQYNGQTATSTNLSPGETATLTLSALNKGNTTWYNTGSYPVRLGTSNPKDRSSAFYDSSSWLSQQRTVTMNEASIAPGSPTPATFTFTIKAPTTPGVYKEYFNLVAEGVTWMNDPGLYWQITVGWTDTLDGVSIPATSGKTAQEQHLYLNSNEAALGRTAESANLHYSNSSVDILFPGISAIKNGMAGGYGSFGSYSNYNLPIEDERYYINMRWNYTEWYEAPDGTCSSTLDGKLDTCTRNTNSSKKAWHYRKRVLVINPANGRKIVASIMESGPAIWTGRVSGLSPEAMYSLGAVTNNNLEYHWYLNQNASLGPIN
jgi:hypothetical protein